jgi:light-harvesting complex I chlorophyll a/b binding protein 1
MGKPIVGAKAGSKFFMKAGNWLPGSDTPAYLTDDLAGNFGFDPMGLAKEPASLKRFQEAELIHCRWAMLGAAGVIAVELLGFGNWYDAPLWAVTGGKATWFGIDIPFDLNTITAVEVVAIAAAEAQRNDNTDPVTRCYPGGAFDPLGFSKDAKNFESMKLKEVKNGRLAMLACLGFVAQHAATGKAPLAALSEHISSPWAANFATNGVSVPIA